MDRLTNQDEYGGACNICTMGIDCDACYLPDIYNKLCHYEDLAEQVRLVELQRGEWIKKHNAKSWTHYTYSCSICDSGSDCITKYCPNCGAKMEAEAKLVEIEQKVDHVVNVLMGREKGCGSDE